MNEYSLAKVQKIILYLCKTATLLAHEYGDDDM